MRVLYLHDYADLSGGAEHQLDKLRGRIEAAGHETQLIASDLPLADPPRYADAAMVRGRTGRAQVASQAANPAALAAVREAMTAFRPDIVHMRMFLWQLSPLVLRALAGVPVVYQACVYKAVCPNGRLLLPDGSDCDRPAGIACLRSGCLTPQTWGLQMGQRALLARYRDRIDATVTLSGRMRDRMTARGWPVAQVIPNGVEERAARPPLQGPPEIGYAGRLDREKGLSWLFAAAQRVMADVPDLRLVIVGDGPDRTALEAEATARGLDARFTGYLSREGMEAALETAWVQAVPSVWDEPFGNVTTEAMMRGTAAVAGAVGGQLDIVDDGVTGALVPPRDEDALTAALSRYVSDRALAEAHGAAGRIRALSAFSDKAVATRFLALYERLIA